MLRREMSEGRMDVRRSNKHYLAIMFGLLAGVAVVYGGTYWLTHGPVPSSLPATTEVQLTSISGSPSDNKNVPIVPVPTVIPPSWPTPVTDATTTSSSVPWTVTMMTDPRSHQPYWMAPPDVVTQVRRDYHDMETFHGAHLFDMTTVDDLKRFYVEPMLGEMLKEETGNTDEVRGPVNFVRPDLQILGFSADGRAVQVAQEFHGEVVPVYSRATHQLIREEKLPVGVEISTLVYDSQDHLWKMSESVFVPGPPGVT
jgi:hypothetical protein